jgi:GrpB-like predicted nucleotidyltransferase (UPF0157 family)
MGWPMKFYEPEQYQPVANQLYDSLSRHISSVLPNARVEHVGSSSIRGIRSKGDLDIFVGVDHVAFQESIRALQSLGFRVKEESLRTECTRVRVARCHSYSLAGGVYVSARFHREVNLEQ